MISMCGDSVKDFSSKSIRAAPSTLPTIIFLRAIEAREFCSSVSCHCHAFSFFHLNPHRLESSRRKGGDYLLPLSGLLYLRRRMQWANPSIGLPPSAPSSQTQARPHIPSLVLPTALRSSTLHFLRLDSSYSSLRP